MARRHSDKIFMRITRPLRVILLCGQSNANTLFDPTIAAPSIAAWPNTFAGFLEFQSETFIIEWVNSGSPLAWPALQAKILSIRGAAMRPLLWHVVWVQGEADATTDPPDSAVYASRLRTVITQIRDVSLCGSGANLYIVALNPNMLPFLPVSPGAAGITAIRSAEADVATDPGNTYIETSDVAMTSIHYDSAGGLVVGGRIGDAIALNAGV